MNHRDGSDGRPRWTVDDLRLHPLFPEALRAALRDARDATWDGEYHPDIEEFRLTTLGEAHAFQARRGAR